ncbi:MAG: DUF885 family protein [Gemmatimonadaceae bacterium]
MTSPTAGGRLTRAEANTNGSSGSATRDPLLDAFFESYYRLRPVNATFTGVHWYDGRLPDWSDEGVERAVSEMRGLRAKLAAEGATELSDAAILNRDWNAIDRALADSFLEIQLAELKGRQFQRGNPSLVIGEAAFAIISLMIRDFAPLGTRVDHASSRLKQLPSFLTSALATIAQAPVPSAWVEKALNECEGVRALLTDGMEQWALLDGEKSPTGVGPTGITEAREALETFARDVSTLAHETTPGRACGEEFLAFVLRRGHWVDRTLDDVLDDVRTRYAAAQRTLEEMARKVDSRGMAGVQEQLAAAHPEPDEYYVAFEATWMACHELSVERDLVTWPQFPIHYVPFPRWTRAAAPSLYYLYYRSPASLELPELHDYVVPPIDTLEGESLEQHLRMWNDSVIKLNHVVHHGALGHHVQNWFAAHAPSRIGQIAATDCASRIGMFLAGTMAEGWACYATDLMNECGFLTPAEEVSEQHTQVRMLARAIVDIEYHTGRRSFEQAVAMYRDEVGMTSAAAFGEATKNSMFPGTALMYWLGTSQIHSLRRDLEARQGERFSLRAFHDELLSFGSIPVAVAARIMLAGA